MDVTIPAQLALTCAKTPERAAWLARVPDTLRDLARRWSLTLGAPFGGNEGSAAWVGPVTRADGTTAVLKLGMPHMEAEHEIDGLRFWNGDSTVRLIAADDDLNAMLIERCEPGTVLRVLPEPEQDVVIAGLLCRLWRAPALPHPFRPLAAMTAAWREEALAEAALWTDPGLVREGLRLFEELPKSAPAEVLLATDLHAGNVLRAQREPWLVIDPKPFVGDPAYDATQHLLNCAARLAADPDGTIRRFSDLLGLDHERVRLWTFARAAVGSYGEWPDDALGFARRLAPS
ncbi:MAG TPA: aminoglycoside phosphotransferase family protein [Ardenticatenaceae bacterium]|nr:aminoglycoside phosphotransferase family protein [Ardenticatenaceae bacterium]